MMSCTCTSRVTFDVLPYKHIYLFFGLHDANDNFIIWCLFGSTIKILYFPLLPCCTFLRYHVALPSIIIFVLSSIICCIFHHNSLLYVKLRGDAYLPKLSIRTFCSYCCVLLVITMLYLRL
jgi:hypothetical protein